MLVATEWMMWGWEVIGEPQTAFSSDGFTISTALWRTTLAGALVEDISDILVGGKLDMNLDRDIKLTATFDLRDPWRITPYTDYLLIIITRLFADGSSSVISVGPFGVPVPPQKLTTLDVFGTVEGRDLTWVMDTTRYADTKNVAAATNIRTDIVAACTDAGLTKVNFSDTAITMPVARSFPVGTSALEKANLQADLLSWYHMSMDIDGSIFSPGVPQDLASMQPWRTLADADIMAPPEVQMQGGEPANQVVLINTDGASAPIVSIATNIDASSPTSTVALGRVMSGKPISISGPITQAALDAMALRYLAERRTFYMVCKLTLLHDPTALRAHQVLDLNLTGRAAALNGRWWIRTATMGLTPGSPLTLECNRVTDTLLGRAI